MFVHLRLHTEFSVIDGTNRIDEIVKAAAAEPRLPNRCLRLRGARLRRRVFADSGSAGLSGSTRFNAEF